MTEIFTPYQAAAVVNNQLREFIEAGIKVDKFPLPGQMFYNYTTARIKDGKQAYIAGTMVNGKYDVDRDDLERWMKAYFVKKGYIKETADSVVVNGVEVTEKDFLLGSDTE